MNVSLLPILKTLTGDGFFEFELKQYLLGAILFEKSSASQANEENKQLVNSQCLIILMVAFIGKTAPKLECRR